MQGDPKPRFESLDVEEASLVFQGLKSLIEHNSGVGFHNHDQSHPIYRFGAEGEPMPGPKDGPDDPDGPEMNTLFNMLGVLNVRLEREGRKDYVWWYDFREWPAFCRFAVESYDRAHDALSRRHGNE